MRPACWGLRSLSSSDGSYTYDPTSVAAIQALDAGDTASDTFTYTITDSQGATSTATVTITLTGVNDSPLAGEDADATDEDTPLAGTLLGNDTDADEDDVLGTTVTVTAFDATSVLGAAVVVSPDGSYTYDPTSVAAIQALDAGDITSDTFTYTITDSQGATSTATVTITLTGVNDSPLAGEDADATDEDTLLAGTLLGNDTDADEDDVPGTTVTVTAFDATSQLGATVVVNPDGSYTYDPTSVAAIQALDAGDTASDTFTYTITDSQGATSTATVTITLTGVNDSPRAGEDADATDEDTLLAGTLLGNDTDADEDDVPGTTVTVTAFDATSQLGATVVVSPDGSYTYDPTSVAAIQALDAGDITSDTFTYTITDSQGASSTATVTITLTGVNDNPLAVDDSAMLDEDTSILIDVLSNDDDADAADVLSILSVGQATNGAAVIVGDRIEYTPDADFNGTDWFAYTVQDMNGGLHSAMVFITVNPVNDAGVFSGELTSEIGRNMTAQGTLVFTDVIDGDNAPNFRVTIVADHGIATIDAITGAWTYTPDVDFIGLDAFTVSVTDDDGHVESVLITISVSAGTMLGDFNNDGVFDCGDINALSSAIASHSSDLQYDLNADLTLDFDDLVLWLALAGEFNLGSGRTYGLGDANLDASVDGEDFVIWNAHKFQSNDRWCDGDFNADGYVDGSDFLLWNGNKFTSQRPSGVMGPRENGADEHDDVAMQVPNSDLATPPWLAGIMALRCRRDRMRHDPASADVADVIDQLFATDFSGDS